MRPVALCADAGVDYKNIIKADLEKDPRVASVVDVGVNASTDKTGECCRSPCAPSLCGANSKHP